jgi:hypothetical protein
MEDGERWRKQDALITIRFFSTALRRSRYDEFGISMYNSFMVTYIQGKLFSRVIQNKSVFQSIQECNGIKRLPPFLILLNSGYK